VRRRSGAGLPTAGFFPDSQPDIFRSAGDKIVLAFRVDKGEKPVPVFERRPGLLNKIVKDRGGYNLGDKAVRREAFEQQGSGRTGLTNMYNLYILICMKTTLHIDDALLREAVKLTGVSEKTALVRMGLSALIARESAKRLAALGGTETKAAAAPRRRSAKAS